MKSINSTETDINSCNKDKPSNNSKYNYSSASSFGSEFTDYESIYDPLDVSGTCLPNNLELRKKVRTKRESMGHGINFSSQVKNLRNFQNNNLNHMIVKSRTAKKSSEHSFSQFFLFSASPEDVLSKMHDIKSMHILSQPVFHEQMQVVDRYPLTWEETPEDHLKSEEVASFCFPSGVQFRFIPVCAKDFAIKKGLVGEEGDRYQLHTVRQGCNIPI